ncbi:hypothetical protein Tco_0418885 [Tanacetum coccineum]
MLIYAKALLFLWTEEVATVCYTQNCSIIRLRHGKTPYELLHDKPPDLSFFHVFDALCYPTNDNENLGKLKPKADIDFDELTAMASEHSSSRPAHHEMTPATISSGLVPNPPPSTPFVPPSRTDWDILFQPMFDELLTPPPSVDLLAPEVIAQIDEVVALVPSELTGSSSSTTVDQDAPSPSNSQTTPETQPPVIPNDVEEDNHDIEVAHMGNDPYFGLPIPEIPSDQSSSSDSIHTIEEVYVSQPDGFVDPDNPYGLKQALRAWYDMLSLFFISQDFSKGSVDPTLFIRTVNRELWYPKDSSIALIAFADADHAGCQDTRRSTSGSMQFLGDKLVSWSSKRQKSAAISSTEAEYIAMSGCCQSIRYQIYIIKEHVENGVIELYFVNTEYQLVDIFTKALAREELNFLINKQGLRRFYARTLKLLADEVEE